MLVPPPGFDAATAVPRPQKNKDTTMPDYAAARFHMVEGQVRPNKVTDQRLVDAMMTVPRELFVPKAVRGIAYVDEDVAIAPGRFLLEPMVFARMLQAAAIGERDVVLDVGCGSGYSAAVIARLAATVVALESDEALAARASAALSETGVDNALVVCGPLNLGHPAQAPYDVIVVNGAVAEVPSALGEQLADGGRMVVTVVRPHAAGEVRMFQRVGGVLSSRVLFEARPPLLPGFEPVPAFEF